MNFTKGDRIGWTRHSIKKNRIITSQGEFVRYVKSQNPGVERVVAILDGSYYEKVLPVSQIKKGE